MPQKIYKSSLTAPCGLCGKEVYDATAHYNELKDKITPQDFECENILTREGGGVRCRETHLKEGKKPEFRVCPVFFDLRREIFFGSKTPTLEDLEKFEGRHPIHERIVRGEGQ